MTRPTLVTGQLQEDGGELVERVARAIAAEDNEEGYDAWEGNPSKSGRRVWYEYARAAIAATRAKTQTPTPGLTDDVVKELVEALSECQDKLWVIHFSLKDKAEREAAIRACNMATDALAKARVAAAFHVLGKEVSIKVRKAASPEPHTDNRP